MKTYILIDLANMYFRARHLMKSGSGDDRIGMSMHIVLNSIRKTWRDFSGSHIVFCLEGRSWRKSIYPQYKAQRAAARAALTPSEQEEERMFWESFDQFVSFLRDQTNCTCLQHPELEADDLISGWVWNHLNDNHVIVSTDGDYNQLISHNVCQYNGVEDVLIDHTGYWNNKRESLKDKKTGENMLPPNPEWLLFKKCMRGDSSDNIFSAFPGIREKSSKHKIGLLEAFGDRHNKGYAWNNVMMQTWEDHNKVIHKVHEDYERNLKLCDLRAQPDHIKDIINSVINQTPTREISGIGFKFLKFCGKYDLQKVSESAETYTVALSAPYIK